MKNYARALVLGLGASGESAARLLASEGTEVTIVDEADTAALRATAKEMESASVAVQLGGVEIPNAPFDVCIVSPGIPPGSKSLREVRRRGIPVAPEFELGWSRHCGRTVAVTGTNGKSTIVKWISETINSIGVSAIPCGNYGYPVCAAVAEHAVADWLVIEASSFQLENVVSFRPDVGVLLNLMPNHLDRHETMESYEAAKIRMFEQMRPSDHAVIHEPLYSKMPASSGAGPRWTTFGDGASADYAYREGRVSHGGKAVADLRGTYFGNDVLGSNAAGAIAALAACGIPPESAEQAAKSFKPLPHRMQLIRSLDGVDFVNDSKATTLAALSAGLRMCRGKARLIAGGLLKEKELDEVKKVLVENASAIYLIGRASETMLKAWSGSVSCVVCDTLERATEAAWRDARDGETVLLSPGCASFDQFQNYAERGDKFAEQVMGLTGRSNRGKQ